ncbi:MULTISPECIES: alpha/beta fold hydrolase [Alphaproteobacteria]|uniref:AB hydrolase-1 domain-containing protein n=2 Tax=Alphaproteobacteria TaxID=28211 RepID=A0A512HNB3_9HYPH|nr:MULTISPECIES: alpha/beta fold hydrolase [Alphaproteobacteria]GEO86948.1 hypothetical protein RNA01_38800 [Ciceribacter naphthalenivorans]GLR23290.1 hypothetical protein GCM10007920_30790 [Ciceribacter naphthalenivorans]GLT06146.1 hypothetical protein GCM10007926_30790 [Sphingomonas psychrolutea]
MEISASHEGVERYMKNAQDSAPALAFVELKERWGDHIPGNPADLWEWCIRHGETTRALGPYSLELFASDLRELLDRLEIDRCHLAGHSLGGMIAQRFALDHPSRLDRLVILSAAAGRTTEEGASPPIPLHRFHSILRWC